MILSFSKQVFVTKIFFGTKIHTIREDKHNRWKQGMKIHAWYGNPRNKNKNPYQFSLMQCTGMQKILIHYNTFNKFTDMIPEISIDGKYLDNYGKIKLATNDGFDTLGEFCQWFNKDFEGKIIHFTEFKYD